MTINDVLAFGLDRSRGMLQMYIKDLTPAEYLHRPAEKANCAAWTVGHLVLTDRRGLAALGVKEMPALPEGFEKRFSRDEGSPQAHEFGDVTILPKLMDEHRDRLIEAVKRATPEQLNGPLPTPHPRFKTPAEMLAFYNLHTAMHAGQITIIRRSLGRPPLI